MSHMSSTSLRYGDNPPKPPVAKTRHLPSRSKTAMAKDRVESYMSSKSDGGDLVTALVYQPKTPNASTAHRVASAQDAVDKASARFG
ncbi:hypothetical protein SUNI508_10838 [Seiridium unicorne]|uniref:Uncharacterized protein n=1 Tax=Seiridium unicorne TaxID=138068 RepID=A0ABR2UJV0_9PEZI